MSESNEIKVLRDLAKVYQEIAQDSRNDDLRSLWRKHNGLEKTRVPILCSWHWGSLLGEHLFEDKLVSVNPILRDIELKLRNLIFHSTIKDDFIFEPWITVPAVYKLPISDSTERIRDWHKEGGLWGDASILSVRHSAEQSEAWIPEPIIKELEDINRLSWAHHEIDEQMTLMRKEWLNDIFKGTVKIHIDRRPLYYFSWGGSDFSTCLGMFLGLQNLMLYMYDKPELIHALAAFMQKGVLSTFNEAEQAGDWFPSESSNTNMGVPYCSDLPDPKPQNSFKMKDLWFFTHGQEFTLISPEMHEEFLLNYQMPIMEKFGLVSYVCCENITKKIKMLRKIPNLRRIGITPTADVEKCADQIQKDYVFSWKPNPVSICCGFEKDKIKGSLEEGLIQSQGCIVDVMLKDITTVQGEPQRLIEWTKIAREVSSKY